MPRSRIGFPLSYQPLWLPEEAIASGPWETIGTSRLSAAAASVSFASIPAAYTMFRLMCEILKDGTQGLILLRLNNDSGANYSAQRLSAYSTTVEGALATAQTSIDLTNGSDFMENGYGTFEVVIAKSVAGAAGLVASSAAVTWGGSIDAIVVLRTAGMWSNVANLINRIDVLSNTTNFAAGSLFILQGSRW